MSTKTIACPRCGQTASGQFCSHCGAALGGTAGALSSVPPIVPWAALGIAVVALAVALAAWFGRAGVPPAPAPELPPFTATLPPPGQSPGQPPDLSKLSPREAADRLFNRVMTAHENRKPEEARQFAPMALAAYERAGAPDNDARYHLGLLHLVTGDVRGARAQIEALRKAVPKHLLATLLEHQIAESANDAPAVARAYEAFLAAYDAEIVAGRSEYEDHRGTLERFYKAAAEQRARRK